MHIKKSTRITSILLSFLAFFSLIPVQPVSAAGGNKLYIDPSSKTVVNPNTFTAKIMGYVDPDLYYVGPDSAQGSVTFSKDILRVTSVSPSTSYTWGGSVTPNNGNGTITFDVSALYNGPTGTVHIATVTFTTLRAGQASLNFSTNSVFDGGYAKFGANVTPQRSGASYTVNNPTCPTGQVGTPPNCTTPPPPTCPAGQIGTPPNCTTPPNPTCPTGQVGTPPNCTTPPKPTQPTTPQNPKPTGPATTPQTPEEPSAPVESPDISEDKDDEQSDFSVSDVTATRNYDSTVLNWKTSEASNAKVSFGSSLQDLDQTVDATVLPDTTNEATLTGLTPGKQYYYTITATSEADETKTDSYSGVFTVRGFPVVITITENKAQAANAKVKIGEQNYSADKSGRISLELASGSYKIDVKTQKGSKSFTLAVAKKTIPSDGDAPETQRFSFDVPVAAAATSSSNNDLWLLLGGLIVGGLLLGGFFFWLIRRRQEQDAQPPTTLVAADTDYPWTQQPPQPAYTDPLPLPPTAEMPPAPGYATDIPVDDQLIPQPQAFPEQEVLPPQDQNVIADDGAQVPEESMEQPVETGQAVPAEPAPEPLPMQPDIPAVQPEMAQMAQPMPAEQIPVDNPPAATEPQAPAEPAAEVVQTPTGSELQINHEARHNSVYIDEEEPKDMFDAPRQ